METSGGAPQLELEIRSGPAGPVVGVRGELDAFTCDDLESCLDTVLASAAGGAVTLDVAELRLIDSLSLAVLVRAHRRLTAAGGRLVVQSPTPLVRQVLEMTGLDQVFTVR